MKKEKEKKDRIVCCLFAGKSQAREDDDEFARVERAERAQVDPAISHRFATLPVGQTEDSVQRCNLRHLLEEHRAERRGEQTQAGPLRASCHDRWDQLSSTTSEFSDRTKEAGRTG